MENMEKNIVSLLWYVIPGIFALAPVFLIEFGINHVLFAFLCFVAGFVIHSIVRVATFGYYFGGRESIQYFRGRLEQILLKNDLEDWAKKEYSKIDLSEPKNIEPVYNFTVWSNPKYKSHNSFIEKRQFFLSAYLTSVVGIFIGMAFLVIGLCCFGRTLPLVLCNIEIDLIHVCFLGYFIILLVFVKDITNLRKDMMAHENLLIRMALNEENRNMTLRGGIKRSKTSETKTHKNGEVYIVE
jgi:hypothetical protein